MRTYNKEKLRELLADRKMRYYLLRDDLYLFGLYYFTHYFLLPSAPFHHEMAEDAMFKDHKYLYWIMFGASAKTTWAKIKLVHMMCYGYKKNIGWVGHDLKKATKNIMSAASELKGNKKIIADFGHLFWEPPAELKKKSRSKTFSQFTTANDVAVRAISTQISQRGEVQDQFRPDFYIIDDIENLQTARSVVQTRNTIEFIEELLRGISVDCDILVLANRIAKNGAVAWLERHLDENPKAVIHEVKIYDGDGKITWPAKFVETIKEAEAINKKIKNKKRHVFSLEQKRHDLGTAGFKREMMNEPADFALAPIKHEWIRRERAPDLATLDLVINVDPAISEKQTADYFSLCVAGRHPSGKIFTLRSIKTRCDVIKQIQLMVNFHVQYPTAKFRIETVAYQKALAQLLEAEKKNGHYIAIEEYKPSTDKILRAHGIAPFIERGDVVFCEGAEIDRLVRNTCDFPMTEDEHDDDVDAFIGAVEYFVIKTRTPGLLVA